MFRPGWDLFWAVSVLLVFGETFARNIEHILVQQVCRHGDRSPFGFFPNYKHKDHWPQGLGYLTPQGMEQCLENGQEFRVRYPNLLNTTVVPSQFKVISSTIDRTIMSADSFLAGLYPPQGYFNFHPGLNWQAVPVHTISRSIDYYLYGTTCPRLNATLNQLFTSPNYLEFLSDNQDFIDEVCRLAGYEEKDYSLWNMGNVNDCFICDEAHNLSLPDWATEHVRTRMVNIYNQYRSFRYSDPSANYLDSGGGPLLGLLLDNIRNKLAGNISQNFIFYSAHDTTILPLMGSLGFSVGPNPPYASCTLFELNKAGDSYYVETYYKNTTEGTNFQPLQVPGCGKFECLLQTFAELALPQTSLHPEKACELPAT